MASWTTTPIIYATTTQTSTLTIAAPTTKIISYEVPLFGGAVYLLPTSYLVPDGPTLRPAFQQGVEFFMALDPPELYFRAATSSPSTSTSSSATITTRTTSTTPSSSRASLSASTPSASAIVDDNGQSLSPGAIAGIVIGVILVLLLVLGGLYFMRRRSLRNRARLENTDDSLPELLLSNKTAGGNEKHAYQTDGAHLPELNDTGRPHELDPSQAQLLADTRRDETRLMENGSEHRRRQGDVIPAQDGNLDGSVERQADPSLHVQAQKKREVEWLEMEEARLRQRREQLLQGNTRAG